jgi:hypothetical protein
VQNAVLHGKAASVARDRQSAADVHTVGENVNEDIFNSVGAQQMAVGFSKIVGYRCVVTARAYI